MIDRRSRPVRQSAERAAQCEAGDGQGLVRWERGIARTRARRQGMVVEMGEGRTPRPKPVTRAHYERVRCLISTDPPPSAGAMIGPATCP